MTASTGDAYLEPRLVGDISGRFYVPAYQRGYRWGEIEVRRLLDDIWESRDKPYYLQPVVVKRHGDEWELVDGQQRLTTLFLIFQYMKSERLQSSGADYSLRYETRADSAAYLQGLDPDLSRKNIDFFHIYEAYQCISEWFDAHEGRRQYVANKFYDALFEHVRVIWYEAADDLDAATLFTRLNVGRIPLTDAELVKALLLSRSRGSLGVTDRALEIAAQWDVIERDLRDPEPPEMGTRLGQSGDHLRRDRLEHGIGRRREHPEEDTLAHQGVSLERQRRTGELAHRFCACRVGRSCQCVEVVSSSRTNSWGMRLLIRDRVRFFSSSTRARRTAFSIGPPEACDSMSELPRASPKRPNPQFYRVGCLSIILLTIS